MKKMNLVVCLAAVLLAACAHDPYSDKSQNPVIKIDGVAARVNPQVLVFVSDPKAKPITITWRLDPTAGFRFA